MRDRLITLAWLLASVALGLVPILQETEKWGELWSPQGLASVLFVVGGVVMSWLRRSPLKSQGPAGYVSIRELEDRGGRYVKASLR